MKTMKQEDSRKSIFDYFEKKFNFKFQTLNFRFPIETLDVLLKKFYKENEQSAFLVQANQSISNLILKRISKSYLLQIPVNNCFNEHLYIGLSDVLCFLILFDESIEEQNISKQQSRFFLTFDSSIINMVFDHFYKNYCKSLSLKEKKLLIKLKNIEPNELQPFYISKFQEALLINALNDNNKLKNAKIIEAISFTDESIVITDLAGNIKEANKNFKKYFNQEENKNNLRAFLPVDIFEAAIKETTKNQRWQQEIKMLTTQNKTELMSVSCYLFKDELNRPNGFVFTLKDITELKKLDYLNKELISKLRDRNLQLSDVNKRLVEADRIKSDLLSVVSHELKTPISTIVGFGELLLNREYKADEVKSYAEKITDSAKQLDRLISDYLDVASDQFGVTSDKVHTMPINLADLIRVCYQEEKYQFSKMGCQFDLNCIGFEPTIISEAENMKKLFGNLINNSLKYSPNGGRISVKILNDSENVTVSISDQGIGLTLDQARKVFEPFYRADNSMTREFPGIGLGLALCKKIVEMYNGSVWCEPGVDLGTVFYVTLPVNPHKPKQKVQAETKEISHHVEAEKD